MKPTLLAALALGIGIAIGLVITRQEFAHETLPLTATASTPNTPAGPATNAGPKLVVVNGERHNFGTMNRNAAGKHTFIIRNDGDVELLIGKGDVSCKCTTFELAKDRLAPGESTEVFIEWKTVTTELQFEQSARLIVVNAPDKPTVALTIEGRVIDVVRPERWELVLTDISANESAHARLKIFAYKGDKLSIEKHEWVNPAQAAHFQIRFEPLSAEELATEAGATVGLALLLDVDQGLPLGSLDETLRLTTNVAEVEPLDIRIRGSVASDILLAGPRVSPDKLLVNLGEVKSEVGSKVTVQLLIKGPFRNDTQLNLVAIEPDSELTATLGEPSRENPKVVRYPLVLQIPAGSRPVARAGDGSYTLVKLSTTHPQVKDLTLRIRYIVTE